MTKTTCPLCKAVTLSDHCTNQTCSWLMCRNESCQAVLNTTRGIGYVSVPEKSRKRGLDGQIATRRRLALIARMWVPRDAL